MYRIFNIYILVIFLTKGVEVRDPCDPGVYKTFPDIGVGSRNENCTPTIDPVCDFYLIEDWYVVGNAKMLGKCPKSGNCGTSYPAWLNGQFPSVSDGEVNRTACIKQDDDCCKSNVTVVVKNCTSFFVYHLQSLPSCPMAYCFESDLPCDPPTTIAPSTQSKSTSIVSWTVSLLAVFISLTMQSFMQILT